MAFNRDEFYRDVGIRLQIARKRKNLTQQELAAAVGVPRATYANLESGRQRATLDVIWKVAAVLRLSLDTLVPEAINAPSPSDRENSPHTAGTAWLTLKT
jgi:transcriptional regulator with XRE-family HTH domain